jgi:5-oxopent-3-ene-1,2,5-tricarboxylate decarboxylase/2-hydroxyhepta-2,4-diene-1,7-dioate isomerase
LWRTPAACRIDTRVDAWLMFPTSSTAVYGVALNFRAELDALAEQLHRDPYKKPPVAPILYLRPRNTWNVPGAPIRLPADATELKMAGTIGAVIGLVPNQVAGYVAVNDVGIPHASYYRPAIRQRCRDGFCIIGCDVTDRVPNEIRILINGDLQCRATIADLVRPIHRLLSDIAEFLTLQPGDIVLIGEPFDAPLARAGDRVRVEIDGLPAIENQVVPE